MEAKKQRDIQSTENKYCQPGSLNPVRLSFKNFYLEKNSFLVDSHYNTEGKSIRLEVS